MDKNKLDNQKKLLEYNPEISIAINLWHENIKDR